NITSRNGQSVSLHRPGAFVSVARGGGFSSPGFVSSQTLAFYNSLFEAKPGQTGGRSGPVTKSVIEAQLSRRNLNGPTYGGPTTCFDPPGPRYMQMCTTF